MCSTEQREENQLNNYDISK